MLAKCRLTNAVFVGGHRDPEMFGWLQLRGMWRQKEQVGLLGHPHSRTVMPAPAPNCSHQGEISTNASVQAMSAILP